MDQRIWEDALFSAEADGRISERSLLGGLRMARIMRWDTDIPGLYWDSESAYSAMGVSKATFYRVRRDLMAAGLLLEERGNLIPSGFSIETPSLSSDTGSLNTETESLTAETNSLRTGTNMHACFAADAATRDEDQQRPPAGLTSLLPISAETDPAEIAAAYPHPDQFPLRAASTFALAALHHWPDAPPVSVPRLARMVAEARQTYSDRVIWTGMVGWLEDNRDSTSIRNPAAVFWSQAPEQFASTHHATQPKEAAL